jgi:hypothetical protein
VRVARASAESISASATHFVPGRSRSSPREPDVLWPSAEPVLHEQDESDGGEDGERDHRSRDPRSPAPLVVGVVRVVAMARGVDRGAARSGTEGDRSES